MRECVYSCGRSREQRVTRINGEMKTASRRRRGSRCWVKLCLPPRWIATGVKLQSRTLKAPTTTPPLKVSRWNKHIWKSPVTGPLEKINKEDAEGGERCKGQTKHNHFSRIWFFSHSSGKEHADNFQNGEEPSRTIGDDWVNLRFITFKACESDFL